MDRKRIGQIIAVLVAFFSLFMVLFNYAIDERETMLAYVIAFTGWLIVLLDELKFKSEDK